MIRRFLRDNALSLALLGLFLASLAGQFLAGLVERNEELVRHGQAALSAGAYATDPGFLSALFENWESEFLQMATLVVLSALLGQRGSPEANTPEQVEGRVRLGRGWVRRHGLGLALGGLFAASFLLHWWWSARLAASEDLAHGREPGGMLAHLASARFWFESFQNWQSEALAAAVLLILSIRLRQDGSAQSK